jgi:hypothetical protein
MDRRIQPVLPVVDSALPEPNGRRLEKPKDDVAVCGACRPKPDFDFDPPACIANVLALQLRANYFSV